ncbi:MAG: DUF1553 domain-containing protein [Acidobacteria bacterium]|nr:DUF1553 domain-containing protein [Acidobacteriota bacterium]
MDMRILLAALAIPAFGARVDFTVSVKPVLDAHCAECHSAKNKTSGFSVESESAVIAGGNKHGAAVAPGHPENSPLIKVLTGAIAPRMPFGKTLAKSEIERLENWIRNLPASSAQKDGEWLWPFQKPVRHAPPAVRDPSWPRNPVDAFIAARLDREGLKPAPEASKRVLARRLYLDLVGVPPSPVEMEEFLNDNSAGAHERLIDRLLHDTRYGERWGRHWLDLVRYGETSGLEGDGAIGNAWRYRDWVIRAFNDDMPYDQFVIRQLGGADEHSQTRNNYPVDVQGHVPLGFFRVAPWDRSNLVADEVRQNYLSEVTTATGSIFLGLSIGCARCHDHKYDPLPQRDYYRLQAFFNTIQVENSDVPYREPGFAPRADAQIRRYQSLLKDGPEKIDLDKLERALLPKLIAARKSAANEKTDLTKEDLRLEMRRGEKSVFPRGVRERHALLLEDANRTQDPEEKDLLDEYESGLMAQLKAEYARPGVDPLARFDALTTGDVRAEAGRSSSKVFNAKERDRHAELSASLEVYRRRLGRWQPNALTVCNVPGPPNGPFPGPTRILTRGDYRQPGEPVTPGVPRVFTAGSEEQAGMITDRYRQFPTRGWRLTLARWIAHRDNPLAARVMVNRVWQHHFGRGIVATASDFGKNGERPTHPELLDWLAVGFMENGWSVKRLHKLILASAAYRQASENPIAEAASKDPDNRLLARFSRRRLEAESLRDSILAASGRLNPEMYGPSMFPKLPEDLADFARYGRGGAVMWEPNEKEEDARRRSIYIFQRRSLPLPMMASFDAIVFSESCDRRSTTTTPLQALSMMNGDLVHEEAEFLAKRAAREAGPDRRAQIARMFEVVLARPPAPIELDQFDKFKGTMAAVGRVLFNSNEFLYVE